MRLLLHGGFSYEMIIGILGSVFITLVLLVFVVIYLARSNYYKNEFLSYNISKKVIYILFLAILLVLITPIIFYVNIFIIGGTITLLR